MTSPTPTQSDEALKTARIIYEGIEIVGWRFCPQEDWELYVSKVIEAHTTAALAAERRKVERLENKVELAREGLNLIMMAYERRVRSACQSYAELANRPWRCYEYTKAENALAALQDEQQGETKENEDGHEGSNGPAEAAESQTA